MLAEFLNPDDALDAEAVREYLERLVDKVSRAEEVLQVYSEHRGREFSLSERISMNVRQPGA